MRELLFAKRLHEHLLRDKLAREDTQATETKAKLEKVLASTLRPCLNVFDTKLLKLPRVVLCGPAGGFQGCPVWACGRAPKGGGCGVVKCAVRENLASYTRNPARHTPTPKC